MQWRSRQWHSHMSARKSLLRLRVRSALYTNDGLESARLALPMTACSPSKYTCHGAPCLSRPLILAVARAGSRLHHSSTHCSSSPPSQVRTTCAAMPSHLLQVSKSSTRACSHISTISDDNNVHCKTICHTYIFCFKHLCLWEAYYRVPHSAPCRCIWECTLQGKFSCAPSIIQPPLPTSQSWSSDSAPFICCGFGISFYWKACFLSQLTKKWSLLQSCIWLWCSVSCALITLCSCSAMAAERWCTYHGDFQCAMMMPFVWEAG